MSSPMGKYSLAAIALGIVAIILSSVATGLVLVQPAKPAPATRDFFLVAGEWKTTLSAGTVLPAGSMLTNGTILTQEVTLTQSLDVERYRWDPVALIVNKGDTVKITIHVVNGRDHTFIISEYSINVTDLDKVSRYTSTEKPPLQFVANKEG